MRTLSAPLLPFLFAAALAATATGQEPAPPPAPTPATTPKGPVDRLLVCNKSDHTLSIFDPTSRQELAVLKTGEGPHEVAARITDG